MSAKRQLMISMTQIKNLKISLFLAFFLKDNTCVLREREKNPFSFYERGSSAAYISAIAAPC